MSVRFYAKGAESQVVEMHNGGARIFLALLGQNCTDNLQGSLGLRRMRARLASLTPEQVTSRAVPSRRIDALEVDHGISAEDLLEDWAALQALVREAERVGAKNIRWG